VVSGEEDDPPRGVRSSIMIYALEDAPPSYPQILSADRGDGSPIPWSAMSGMTAIPGSSKELLAVWDSFYSQSKVFTLDVSEDPARVTAELDIQGGTGDFDPEGIAVAPDGSYWIASEGNASGTRPNRLLKVDPATGTVLAEIGLPQEIEACRAASTNRGTLGSGFEGVAVMPEPRGDGYRLLVAQQRGWDYTTPECEALDDDHDGNDPAEPTRTRVWIYDPDAGTWDHLPYALEPVPADADWVGLSEITRVAKDGAYVFIERDNRTGDFAVLKTLVRVDAHDLSDGVSRGEKRVHDLIPDLEATNGWITDKPEGVAVTDEGRVYVITDNDGVDGWSGETWFLRLGEVGRLFGDRDDDRGKDGEAEREKGKDRKDEGDDD
jgi:hypothetical protein